jgi:hypothetical protein
MRTEIRLSPIAIKQIEDTLTDGKAVEMRVIGGKLVIFETSSKKKYEVVVTSR